LPLLGLVTVIALWSSLWAVLSRVFFGQARFALQLRIAVTACIALVVWDQITESLSYSLAWRDIAEYGGLGAWAVLAAACWGHLHAIGPKHMRAAMGLVVALIAAGAMLQYFGKSEQRKLVGQRATLGAATCRHARHKQHCLLPEPLRSGPLRYKAYRHWPSVSNHCL